MARLRERYEKEIRPKWMEERKLTSPLAVPRLDKITVSMGVGKATENKNRVEAALKDLTILAGQKAQVCRAKKSVANFKLREGEPIGCRVTLRGDRMWEFLDRLISVVIPRVRDFRGLSRKAFDKAGNYNLGLTEQTLFPEIKIDQVEFQQGMNIAIGICAKSPEESFALLQQFGMPFRK